jgi:hypothetical protein
MEIYLFTNNNNFYFFFPIAQKDLANLEKKKQALAKKADRNSNDGDRSPPSLEDLKRRGK